MYLPTQRFVLDIMLFVIYEYLLRIPSDLVVFWNLLMGSFDS